MKKLLLVAFTFFATVVAFSQTPEGSFKCNITNGQKLSTTDISSAISRINFENYRLRDKRTSLTFDNGFEIVLLSAQETQVLGLIVDASHYQKEFLPKFVLPVFHMTPDGKVSAAYATNSKYSSEKR